MSKETKKFAEAFAIKDEVEGFLANLEQLKADGTITEEQHATLKEEYDTRLNAALSEIARIKSAFKKQLETTQRDTETYKWELGKIEVKFKVGELPLDKYQSSDRKLRAKIEEVEAAAEELERLIKANSSADIAAPAKKPGIDIRELPTISKVATPAKAAAPLKEIKLPKAKAPKAKAPELPSLTRAAPSAEGLLTPRTKLLAMIGGALLLISIFLPWVGASGAMAAVLASTSGMGISVIIGAVGIVCGLSVVLTAFFFSSGRRGAIQITMGVISLAALLIMAFGDVTTVLRELIGESIVIREGIYLYLIAAVMVIVAGSLELRRRGRIEATPRVSARIPGGKIAAGPSVLEGAPLGVLRKIILSHLGVVGLAIGVLMLISILVLPWVSFSGLGLSILQVNVVLATLCLIAALAYTGVTFVKVQKTRALIHIGVGTAGLILFLVTLFSVMRQIARFAESVTEVVGIGFWLFVVVVIAGIIVGAFELRQPES